MKVLMKWIRRGHLYLGLFLFPWAILYGVSGFLFNHPTAFSDQPTTSFGSSILAGTSFENRPTPQAIAEEVVRKLNESQKPEEPYELAGEAKFNREFAFATVKAKEKTVSVLIDVKNGGGTVRSAPVVEPKVITPAPFAIGAGGGGGPRGGGGGGPRGGGGGGPRPVADGIFLDSSIAKNVEGAIPAILENTKSPTGTITVTSVPDVAFPIRADDRIWNAVYNPMTGAISGLAVDEQTPPELGWRRFLLRLHTTHGYPGETNGRWWWAVIVDAMAFVMVFWGLSGLLMWWQIKATRIWGLIVLVLSAVAATSLGIAMYAAMRT